MKGELFTTVRREVDDIAATVRDTVGSVRSAFRNGKFKDLPRRMNEPSGFNPIKFRKLLVTIIKLLIVFEFLSAFMQGLGTDDWSRFGTDLIFAGIVYILWDRITEIVRQKKDEYRRKMEHPGGNTKLVDAFLFSLLWSDEIYMDIPQDMRRLVVIAYTLIAISVGAIFFGFGEGLIGLIVCSSLLFAAVNLLAWVVSRERGEKDTLKTELKLAHDVQLSLMPKEQPRVEGLDVAGISIPAREVGGDHFDYAFMGSNGRKFGVCVFDVSGKGMQAAMSAVFMSGAFASEARQSSSPGDILTRLNRLVCLHAKRGHFIALLLAVFDLDARTLTFANAGQMKPLLLSNGVLTWLDAQGVHFPLGMKDDLAYAERTIQLHQGDIVCLLTDGITEAMDSRLEQFGQERLEQLLVSMKGQALSSRKLLD
ncbi:MAG TPA: PP2C family protein-serine/threonine phosphatase, partial [Bacteroidota bacterium]|nr:PP2C family protein-serine/threonine phosphatase [Bacteroidota bacterium]